MWIHWMAIWCLEICLSSLTRYTSLCSNTYWKCKPCWHLALLGNRPIRCITRSCVSFVECRSFSVKDPWSGYSSAVLCMIGWIFSSCWFCIETLCAYPCGIAADTSSADHLLFHHMLSAVGMSNIEEHTSWYSHGQQAHTQCCLGSGTHTETQDTKTHCWRITLLSWTRSPWSLCSHRAACLEAGELCEHWV